MRRYGKDVNVIWHDTKRFWGMPITFTNYAIIEKPGQWLKFVVESGIFATHIEEFHLYKIDDVSVFQSLFNKVCGVGCINIYVNDSSTKVANVLRVKDPYKVYDLIASYVEKDKTNRRVIRSEHLHENSDYAQ